MMPQYTRRLIICWERIGGTTGLLWPVLWSALAVLQADGHRAESSASGKLTGPLPWDILDELSEDDDLSTTAGMMLYICLLARECGPFQGCIARDFSPSLLKVLLSSCCNVSEDSQHSKSWTSTH